MSPWCDGVRLKPLSIVRDGGRVVVVIVRDGGRVVLVIVRDGGRVVVVIVSLTAFHKDRRVL